MYQLLHSISEVSDLTGLSKVSIYKRLKLKEYQPYIVKNEGKNYVTEGFLTLMGIDLNSNGTVKDELNESGAAETTKQGTASHETELISYLKEQLRVKDDQISELMNRLAAEQETVHRYQALQLNQKPEFKLIEAEAEDQQESGQTQTEQPQKRGLFNFGKKRR